MEFKISAFIFVLLYTVYCKPTDSNDFVMDGDYDVQNDNTNYPGEYEEADEAVEESKMPGPLKITTTEQTFIKSLSETVVLPCTINGSNFVQIWRKKNAGALDQSLNKQDAVLFQSEIRMAAASNMRQLKDGSLEISNLHVQDSGEYECVAMETAKNSPKILHTLILKVPPQIELLEAKNNLTVLRNGDALILTCRANGYPKPAISWHRGSSRFDIKGEVLEIREVKHRDAGMYKCLADNKIGEPAFRYINIKVEFKPVITIERISVSSENNSDTELECLVHSEPRAQVVWLKDGRTLGNSERVQLVINELKHNLILKDLQDSDFGVYTCSATNSLGSSKKTISLVPTPAIFQFTKSQTDAKEIVLTWEVQSKSNLSAHELLYSKKGKNDWKMFEPEAKPEVNASGSDIYEVKYTLRGLDPGDYDIKFRCQNNKGWSDYVAKSVEVNAKHGHHKSHKKGHKQGKERQITPTPTIPSQPDVPAEHQESENQSGFIKESASPGPTPSGTSSVTPGALLISIALFTFLQFRLASLRI